MRRVLLRELLSLALLLIWYVVGDAAAIDLNGIVLAYSFDKTDGETVRDESPAVNDGTRIGDAVIVDDGKFGSALELDGFGDQLITPMTDSLMITGAMTVMAWVNFRDPADPEDRQTIVQKLEHFGNRGAGGWMLSTANGGSAIEWSIATDPKRMRNIFQVPVPAMVVGEWYQIVGTWTDDEQSVYLNGELVGETPSLGNVQTPSGDPVKIGARDQANDTFFFNGKIDEVLIAARLLTADEMAEHRELGVTQALGVSPGGKLGTVWAALRQSPMGGR